MAQLQYDRKRLTLYLDTVFFGATSIRQYNSVQVIINGNGYDFLYPMRAKYEAGLVLAEHIRSTWIIPEFLVTDGAGEERYGEWNRIHKQFCIEQQATLPYSP